ncbi:hypothetical protein I79_004805 [Cricetulus griseus]|uniref:Uncharacterized protein n=1 Tax=Cricetulus griseus TaxID=10029 RepID=G3H3L7_CRIGR|nr:hypothetical protein I79_004805 [Cricetulus griseus]
MISSSAPHPDPDKTRAATDRKIEQGYVTQLMSLEEPCRLWLRLMIKRNNESQKPI